MGPARSPGVQPWSALLIESLVEHALVLSFDDGSYEVLELRIHRRESKNSACSTFGPECHSTFVICVENSHLSMSCDVGVIGLYGMDGLRAAAMMASLSIP